MRFVVRLAPESEISSELTHLACKSEGIPKRAQRRPRAQQGPLARHEVRISGDLGRSIELREDGLEESILSRDIARGLELGDPERFVSARSVSLVDVGHECGCVAAVVPVDADKVDLAACTRGEEISEPGEAHGATAVGDGWGAELGLAGERHHVGLVAGGCCGGREVRLAVEVGLVHGHQVGGAGGDGLGGCGIPAGGEG